jgi:enamine deaminase RidA (YjgF/YER057c/UK114 family)
MEKHRINPWTWQDAFGYSQAWRVDAPTSTIYVAGQGPIAADGSLVDGDFDAQVRQTFENMRTVLEAAGGSLDGIVKLTVYLTDISRLREYGAIRAELLAGAPPAGTAVQVVALAAPGMQIEVDAIAVV